jgi:hypothetical protein
MRDNLHPWRRATCCNRAPRVRSGRSRPRCLRQRARQREEHYLARIHARLQMKATTTRTLNPLPFQDLEPRRFEDLIRQLAYDFREWKSLEAIGRSGADEGMDIRSGTVIGPPPMWCIRICSPFSKASPEKYPIHASSTMGFNSEARGVGSAGTQSELGPQRHESHWLLRRQRFKLNNPRRSWSGMPSCPGK